MSDVLGGCLECEGGVLHLEIYSDWFNLKDKWVLVKGLECGICNQCGADPLSAAQVRANQMKISDAAINTQGQAMKSPCRNKCTADHPSGICQGCGRTVCEVRDWNGYSDKQKLKVLERIIMSDDFKKTTQITLESEMNRVDYDSDTDAVYVTSKETDQAICVDRSSIPTLLMMLKEAERGI